EVSNPGRLDSRVRLGANTRMKTGRRAATYGAFQAGLLLAMGCTSTDSTRRTLPRDDAGADSSPSGGGTGGVAPNSSGGTNGDASTGGNGARGTGGAAPAPLDASLDAAADATGDVTVEGGANADATTED